MRSADTIAGRSLRMGRKTPDSLMILIVLAYDRIVAAALIFTIAASSLKILLEIPVVDPIA